MSDPLQPTKDKIDSEVKGNKIVLFMKGNKEQPMCGFSAQVVQVLNHFNADYITHDVLQDPDLRQAIKEYSDWPTLPQLYVGGEFVGGCDIVVEMAQNGELEPMLS